jgi:UDP-N-acetyl-D-mannosaminuronic acid transferase (WecB/TagA/CpsF family)
MANMHMAMEKFDPGAFRRLVNGADLVTMDGVPLVWGLRGLGIGAAFDFYAGRVRDAPRWMQKMGLAVVVSLTDGASEAMEALREA